MSNIVAFNDFSIVTEREDAEQFALLQKYLETFYEIAEQYESIKFEYDKAKFQLEQMCEKANKELGFRSMKGRYQQVTFVPGTEGKTIKTKVLSETKILELLDELGIDPNEFYVETEKTSGVRKASIRYKQ